LGVLECPKFLKKECQHMWFELEIVVFVVWTKPKWEFGWGNELIDEEWVYIVQFF
jgi:hypothetical protein